MEAERASVKLMDFCFLLYIFKDAFFNLPFSVTMPHGKLLLTGISEAVCDMSWGLSHQVKEKVKNFVRLLKGPCVGINNTLDAGLLGLTFPKQRLLVTGAIC